MKEEILDRSIERVRESIDTIASEEVKELIDELELLLWVKTTQETKDRYELIK